jgi:hypothetical protein
MDQKLEELFREVCRGDPKLSDLEAVKFIQRELRKKSLEESPEAWEEELQDHDVMFGFRPSDEDEDEDDDAWLDQALAAIRQFSDLICQ